MSRCQLANLREKLVVSLPDSESAVANQEEQNPWFSQVPHFIILLGSFKTYFQYLALKRSSSCICKVHPLFFILIALLGYHLHAIKVLHLSAQIQ